MSFEGNRAVRIRGTTVRAGSVAFTDASGGTSLGSGSVAYGLTVSLVSGTIVWLGGNNDLSPFSGNGGMLLSGQSMILNVTNLNQVRGVGAASGAMVTYIGVDF